MEQSPLGKTPAEIYDEALDSLADKLGSYDLARRELGDAPYETVETFVIPTQPAKAELGRRAVAGHSHYYPSRGPRGEEDNVGLPNGEPLYFRRKEDAILSEDQVATNMKGLAEIRRVLAEAAAKKQNKQKHD